MDPHWFCVLIGGDKEDAVGLGGEVVGDQNHLDSVGLHHLGPRAIEVREPVVGSRVFCFDLKMLNVQTNSKSLIAQILQEDAPEMAWFVSPPNIRIFLQNWRKNSGFSFWKK